MSAALPVFVRGMDQRLWRRLRATAVARGVTIAQLLAPIVRAWLDSGGRTALDPCPTCGHVNGQCPVPEPVMQRVR